MRHFLTIFLLFFSSIINAADVDTAADFAPCSNNLRSERLEFPSEHITWEIEDDTDDILSMRITVSDEINGKSFFDASISKFDEGKLIYSYEANDYEIEYSEDSKVHIFHFIVSENELNDISIIANYGWGETCDITFYTSTFT